MQNEKLEAISALIDGELPDDVRDELIGDLLKSDTLRDQWTSLHFTREAMSPDYVDHLPSDFASRVASAIDDEPALLVSPAGAEHPSRPAWQKPFAGFALAASVAAIAVLGVDWGQQTGSQTGPLPIASEPVRNEGSGPDSASTQLASALGTYWSSQPGKRDMDVEKRLNMYLSDHIESATASNIQGLLAYSKLVAYDGER